MPTVPLAVDALADRSKLVRWRERPERNALTDRKKVVVATAALPSGSLRCEREGPKPAGAPSARRPTVLATPSASQGERAQE